jgi:hypothetical protein
VTLASPPPPPPPGPSSLPPRSMPAGSGSAVPALIHSTHYITTVYIGSLMPVRAPVVNNSGYCQLDVPCHYNVQIMYSNIKTSWSSSVPHHIILISLHQLYNYNIFIFQSGQSVRKSVPEFIAPVFAKTNSRRSF